MPPISYVGAFRGLNLFELLFTTVDNYQYIETSIIAQGIRMIIDKIGGI